MMKKILSIVLVFMMLCLYTVPAIAATKQELQEQKENAEQQKAEAEAQKEEVTAEKDEVLDEISELTAEISKYENEIEKLNEKIDSLESSISGKEEEIAQLEKETKEKQDLLIDRLVAMYEKGQTTYLDVLLSSEDITSLISNYYRIEELASADPVSYTHLKQTTT